MPWQVIVVGAGPAGSATALRLAARGVRTLLIDRQNMPRWKVCGCCMSTAAAAELADLAIATTSPSVSEIRSAPLDTVRFVHRGRSVVLPFTAGGVMAREALDTSLVRAAIAAGCHWLPGCEVVAVDDAGNVRHPAPGTVRISCAMPADEAAGRLESAFVVLATGLSNRVRIPSRAGQPGRGTLIASASRIGVGGLLPPEAWDLPSGQLVMAVGTAGYCGLVRLADQRIDLAAAVDRRMLATHGGPAEAVLALLAEATPAVRLSPSALGAAGVRATPPLTRSAPPVADGSGQILRVGDAATYVEPFTGEGIGWALAAGRLAARALMPRQAGDGLPPPAEALTTYATSHRDHFTPRHRRCRRVAWLLRHPTAVAAAVGAARLAPWLAGRIVPVLVGAAGVDSCP